MRIGIWSTSLLFLSPCRLLSCKPNKAQIRSFDLACSDIWVIYSSMVLSSEHESYWSSNIHALSRLQLRLMSSCNSLVRERTFSPRTSDLGHLPPARNQSAFGKVRQIIHVSVQTSAPFLSRSAVGFTTVNPTADRFYRVKVWVIVLVKVNIMVRG